MRPWPKAKLHPLINTSKASQDAQHTLDVSSERRRVSLGHLVQQEHHGAVKHRWRVSVVGQEMGGVTVGTRRRAAIKCRNSRCGSGE